MKISLNLNSKNSSFGSKKPEIRLADDIMRKSMLDFQCFSPVYAERSYLCLHKDAADAEKAASAVRHSALNLFKFVRKSSPYAPSDEKILDRIKKYKLGNCFEKSLAAMAELSSFGYKSKLCMPELESVLFKKNSGEIIENKFFDLDHVFVCTAMNNEQRIKKNKFIIIDPWLGFASEKEDAVLIYKKFFEKNISAMRQNVDEYFHQFWKISEDMQIKHTLKLYDADISSEFLEKIYNYMKRK